MAIPADEPKSLALVEVEVVGVRPKARRVTVTATMALRSGPA